MTARRTMVAVLIACIIIIAGTLSAGAESLLAPSPTPTTTAVPAGFKILGGPLTTQHTIIRVDDYTTPGWSATVIESVAELNAVLPDTVTLEYHGIPEVACTDIEPEPKTIALCSTAEEIAVAAHEARDGIGGTMAGTTEPAFTAAGDWFMLVTLADENLALTPWAFTNNVALHELIHALTLVTDCYDADANSAVWGRLTEPGSTDVMWLTHVWETPTPAWMTSDTCP